MNPKGFPGKFGAGGIWAEDPVKFARVNSIFLNELATIDSGLSFPLPRSGRVGSVLDGRVNEPSESAKRPDLQAEACEVVCVEAVVEPVVDGFVDSAGDVGDGSGVVEFGRAMGGCVSETSHSLARLSPGMRVDDASIIVGAQPTRIFFDTEYGVGSEVGSSFAVEVGVRHGSSYLNVIRAQWRKSAQERLGDGPRLVDLLSLPAAWFIDHVDMARMPVEYFGDTLRFGVNSSGVKSSVYTCFSSLTGISSVFEVLAHFELLIQAADPVNLSAKFVGEVATARTLGFDNHQFDVDGMCYLRAVCEDLAVTAFNLLGKFPSVVRLRALPLWFYKSDRSAVSKLGLSEISESVWHLRDMSGIGHERFSFHDLDLMPSYAVVGAVDVGPDMPGYEYLRLCKPAVWSEIGRRIGPHPSFRRMLDFPEDSLVTPNALQECGIVGTWTGQLDAIFGGVTCEFGHFSISPGWMSHDGVSIANALDGYEDDPAFRPWVRAAAQPVRGLRRWCGEHLDKDSVFSCGQYSYLMIVKTEHRVDVGRRFGDFATWRQLLCGLTEVEVDSLKLAKYQCDYVHSPRGLVTNLTESLGDDNLSNVFRTLYDNCGGGQSWAALGQPCARFVPDVDARIGGYDVALV